MSEQESNLNAFRDFEQNGWDSKADLYDEYFGRHTMLYCPALLDAAGIGPAMQVLDIACGPGYVSAAAAARGADVIGIDFAPNMVSEARRLHPGPRFEVGDAEALPFDDDTFDAVVMGFGILHLARPERAAEQAFRVLKPGGRYAITAWGDPETACIGGGIVFRAMLAHANLDLGLPEGPPFFRFGDRAESHGLLAGAGFEDVVVEAIMNDWVVDSADAIFHAFREAGVRTGATLRAQTPEAVDAIRNQISEDVRKFERNGRFEVPMGAVLTSGRKPVIREGSR